MRDPGANNKRELVISLQTLPLQSVMHKLDECFILSKGTVWRGITDINTLPRVGHYTREI